ncbi:unnamed protein product [Brassica napus]|uniref:(rape) hypothetical protein n=1 Tax=Brassica napus TaxID=3708 RepID=A0A816MZ18_BRANA|nr:unnamed protein product [Brassica napus]
MSSLDVCLFRNYFKILLYVFSSSYLFTLIWFIILLILGFIESLKRISQ